MYSGDHIVLSASYGIYASRALGLPLLPTLGVAIATNIMDFDHQVFYYLDDGKANSLTLHPLHVYAGCLIFFLHMIGLYGQENPSYRRYASYGTIILGSISLHLTADAIAWAAHYSILMLLGFSAINCIFLIWVVMKFLQPTYRAALCLKLCSFLIGWLVICHLQLALFEYVLGIHAPESRWAFFFNPLLTVIAALSLLIFSKTPFSSKHLR